MVVCGTEVHAEVRDGITVRVNVSSAGRTIVITASNSIRKAGAGGAKTIIVTVKGASCSITVIIAATFNTNTGRNIALGLIRYETSIVDTVSVLGASKTSITLHAVVTSSTLFASIVVLRT